MKEPMKLHHGLDVTIITTEDCNLRCKYCYEINKKPRTIPIEYIEKFIDLILPDPNINGNSKPGVSGITFNFLGGDSLMDVELLDNAFTYIIKSLYKDSTYAGYRVNPRFSISTNGTLFNKKEVRDFCLKWRDVLSLTVSVDGCPELHDLNRVYENGKGSMSEILKYWDWYKGNFSTRKGELSTKSTLSKDSIPYLYESLIYLHETLGISDVSQNFIMEDTKCIAEDYKLLVSELSKCLDYLITHRSDLYYSIFGKEYLTHRLSTGSDWNASGQCGSGSMPCLGINGNIYPCFRWAPHSQAPNNPEPFVTGDIWKGMYNKDAFKKVREGAYRCNCTKETKCMSCEYEASCPYCIGGCYAEFQEFRRTTYICELTKIQCEYAKRYWNEYNKLENVLDENGSIKYYPIDRHYDVDKYYYDPEHIYNPE